MQRTRCVCGVTPLCSLAVASESPAPQCKLPFAGAKLFTACAVRHHPVSVCICALSAACFRAIVFSGKFYSVLAGFLFLSQSCLLLILRTTFIGQVDSPSDGRLFFSSCQIPSSRKSDAAYVQGFYYHVTSLRCYLTSADLTYSYESSISFDSVRLYSIPLKEGSVPFPLFFIPVSIRCFRSRSGTDPLFGICVKSASHLMFFHLLKLLDSK